MAVPRHQGDDVAPGPVTPSGLVTTPDGAEVAYYELGGEGPPLLLVHATGLCGQTLAPLARRLGGRRRLVAVDLRGHGASALPPGGGHDWHGFAADVLAVVDHLDLQRPAGFGHSCGGAALLLAEQARPGAFAALYCFEPVVYPGDEPLAPTLAGNPLAAAALRRRRRFDSRDDALANFAAKAPFDRVHPEALAAYVDNGFALMDDGGVVLRCRPEDEAQVFAHAFSHDAFARLGLVRCPVTLACGADTGPADGFGPEFLAAYSGRLRRSTTVVVDGVGHFGPLEDPDATAASVADALAGSVADAGARTRFGDGVPVAGTPPA